ncbi:MAG TPA: hypothetical protein VFS21_03575 [Roseiflexaceae bacterium]|nr:hypothetical protein [Roseiflexaceae bacterium]
MATPVVVPIYREARTLLEMVAAGEPGALEAVQRHLEAHCGSCGRSLVGPQRQAGSGLCEWCDPRYGASQTADGSLGPLTPVEPPIDLTAWSSDHHARLRRFWQREEVQQLIADLAALGVSLPLRTSDGRPAGAELRRRFYGHAEVMDAVVRAARAGVGVRYMATLLFNGLPGSMSHEIGREIDKVDPTARK